MKILKNNFAKLRYLLTITLLVVLTYFIFKTGIATIAVLILIIGSIFLSLNRKWFDYSTFSIFIFGFALLLTNKIRVCFLSSMCWENVYINIYKEEIILLVLILSVLTLLIVSFADGLKNK